MIATKIVPIVGSLAPALLGQLQPFSSNDRDGASFWLPPAVSSEAGSIDWVFYFLYWLCVFFFVLVVALMIAFVVRYKRGNVADRSNAPSHHTALELTWTIIPLGLVVAIFYVGLKGYLNVTVAPANAYEVNVLAQKWNWTFEHRNGATTVNHLKVPLGQPVKLIMRSQDVLHSFFVPSFRIKQDVVPGRYTTAWFQADRPGIYQVFCTEYCGTQHSQMTAMVEVLEPAEFERQIAEDANWLDKVTDEDLHVAGLRLFARCASCHSLQENVRLTGPSFWELHDDWGKERLLEDGRKRIVDENYVRESILYPQQDVVATYPRTMPSFQGQLKPREIDALIAFVKRLDEVVGRDGKPVGSN